MSFRTARRAAVAMTALAVTTVGCGSVTQLSARQELSNSLGALDDRSTLTVEVTIDATAERLVELAEAGDGTLTLEQAEVLVGSSLELTMASQDGTALEDLSDDATPNLRAAVRAGDGELFDVRVVDGDLFARADVARIGELAGEPAPTWEELGLDGVPGLGFLEAALAGRWIVADGEELSALGETFGATAPEEATEPDQATIDELTQRFSDAFDRTVTVTEDGSDPELGDRTLLEASPRRLVAELSELVDGLETPQGDAGELLAPLEEDLADVPDEPVTVEVYRRDGVVSAIRLDLAQFEEDGSLDGVAVLARFTTSDDGVEVPVDATPVDLEAVTQLVMTSLMSSDMSA